MSVNLRYETGIRRLSARIPKRVPTIGPKEQRDFDITYTLLADKSAVDKALQQVKNILQDRPTEVREKPLVDLPKN